MTVEEVIKFYGSGYKFSNATGMSRNSCINWKKKGYIPVATQYKLEKLTNGALKADYDKPVN